MADKEALIAGYIEELAQAERRGDKFAADAVRAELKALGSDGTTPAQRAEKLAKPKDVHPELRDKSWVKGEPTAAATLTEDAPLKETEPAAAAKDEPLTTTSKAAGSTQDLKK